jgi:hypothetical protein
MLLMFNECFDRLEQMGSRSRMLLQHYENHPNQLYLPPELEHLRGKPLSTLDIGRVMLLDGDLGSDPPTIAAKSKGCERGWLRTSEESLLSPVCRSPLINVQILGAILSGAALA